MKNFLRITAGLLILFSLFSGAAGAFDRVVLHEGFTSTT